jgi:NSS family neurotransmitter:Na+ symporter
MMLAMLGMAVGTGNIWRFPRIAAQNGGGEFLVAWVAFLLLWSIPLIMVEFGAGRLTRTGPIGAFMQLMGPRWAWMGAWVAFVTIAIMFYYSVVTGWTLRYVAASLAGEVPRAEPGGFWREYTTSWWPVLTHGVAMGLGTFVVVRGVRAIERVAGVMMPTLLVLVVLLALRAVTLPGAGDGLAYLFTVDWPELGRARIWLEALTQNAWDTGMAGDWCWSMRPTCGSARTRRSTRSSSLPPTTRCRSSAGSWCCAPCSPWCRSSWRGLRATRRR